MADAAVEFLLGNLKELVVYNYNLISDVKDLVDSLCDELRLLAAFVKDATAKRSSSSSSSSDYAIVKELVRRVRVKVYKAEDVVESFVVYVAVQKARSSIQKAFHIIDYPLELRKVAKDIESIQKEVKSLYDNKFFGFEALQMGESSAGGGGSSSRSKRPPVVEEDNVVGFDKEAETVIGRLTAGPDELQLRVISVIGMGGLGKTTLARKVYNDPSIHYKFFIRAWVYVSQVYSRKEVFLGILSSISRPSPDMYKMTDDALAEELRRRLEGRKYLIVTDDVWTKEAWDDLKMAFPKNNNGSRIMLTSRNREVAVHANPDGPPHQLRFLTDDEGWELLCKKVFRKEGCRSKELEELGKQIAKKCFGLPLAIVVIAGILLKKEKTRDLWEKVAESVSSYVAMEPKECMDVLGLSYNHLPYHLKACFLYFGAFPEDFEIPVWKLIHLWIAEGFIQRRGDISLEDIAEDNLEDLVDRNLVLVEKRRSNGTRIKTCRVHDMLHDLCVKEAEEENFFREIRFGQLQAMSDPAPVIFRRLCVHSRVVDYLSSKPSAPHVRAFLCFALQETVLPPQNISAIPGVFKLLRVLDIRPIRFTRFPSELIQLVHLRYVALLGDFKVLPKATADLWNLQTLIVETRNLDIQADIWNMVHLSHLYTGGLTSLPRPRKGNKDPRVSTNLQTISTILPESCGEKILVRTPNLKKLGIRGKLVTLVEEKGGSSMFDSFSNLVHLETLKLLNETYPHPPSDYKLPGLPHSNKFPPKLKKLTLSDTLLDWEHMSTLGKLPGLEVLKLRDNAFKGRHWETLDGDFLQLRVLQLGRTDIEEWKTSGGHFPKLQQLILKNCESLKVVPSGLGDISTLQVMELYFPTRSAATSAKEIQHHQQQSQQQQSRVKNGFKLLIYPPDL